MNSELINNYFVIVDDHPLTRLGLRNILNIQNISDESIIEFETGENLLQFLENNTIGMILLDIDFPGNENLEIIKMIRTKFPDMIIVIYTMLSGEGIFREICEIGVQGYFLKTDDIYTLSNLIKEILTDKEFKCSESLIKFLQENYEKLSQKEFELIMQLGKGLKPAEIAKNLSLSKRTVEYYIDKLKKKFGILNIYDLIYYIRNNYFK